MTNRFVAAAAAVLLGLFLLTACSGEESAAAGEEGVAASENSAAAVLSLETFLTNINDPKGEKHARVQIKLAIVPVEALDAIQGDDLLMARLNDRVLTLLTTKTYQELNDPEGKETFRNEIRDQLNPLLTKGKVKEVLFSDFVVE